MMIFCSGSWILLICVCVRVRGAELLNLTARLGHSVTLPCQAVEQRPFIAVEWTRRDLSPDVVYFHMENSTFPPDLQNPLFVGRVDLLDGGMKSGNMSINLRNVSINHTGLYECRVQDKHGRPHKRSVIDSEPLSVISLTVEEPGDEAGGPGFSYKALAAGGFLSFIFVAVLIFVIYKQCKQQNSYSPPPEADKVDPQNALETPT